MTRSAPVRSRPVYFLPFTAWWETLSVFELSVGVNDPAAEHLVVLVGDGVGKRIECRCGSAGCRRHNGTDPRAEPAKWHRWRHGSSDRSCPWCCGSEPPDPTACRRRCRIAQVSLGVSHVIGRGVGNDCPGHYFAFQVTCCAVGILKGNAGHVVRPLGEFGGDGADAVIVVDHVAGMLDGDAMAGDTSWFRRG